MLPRISISSSQSFCCRQISEALTGQALEFVSWGQGVSRHITNCHALAGFIDLALLSEQRHVEIRSRIPSSSSLSSWQMGLGDGLAGSRRAVLAYQ
ncbi:uncharacterized protein LMH87_009213 [Akanthomyces muscarius]|uniref:Uncharacterized protein n=1 Tax=Akanthomyces muscarius TaxID=2231603 RepID=A0A9W8QIE5_AKAMU|nr:uncharacterized protein LMH87_009213 [Akanthomyces muscarius]KAJ4158697.1 hypothetical protein LMH87_009213 [Akanthomyces muscarius]